MRLTNLAATFLLVGFISISQVSAAPGDLDPTFGTGGTVVLSSSASSTIYRGVREFPDGHLLVFGGASSIYAKKLFPTGGTDFIYRIEPNSGSSEVFNPFVPGIVYDAEILASGEVIFAGKVRENPRGVYRPAIWKFRADGVLDQTFGTNGRIFLSSAEGEATQVEMQGTKIYVLYAAEDAGRWLTRRNSNGSFDLTFGTLGQTSISEYASKETGGMIVSPSPLKIYIAGGSLSRYNANGSLDSTFGGSGNAPNPVFNNCPQAELGDPTGYYFFWSVAFGADGSLYAAGQSAVEMSNYYIYWSGASRYTSNGSIDLSFNNGEIACGGGSLSPPLPTVALQADGKSLIGGPAVARFNMDGSTDAGYPYVGQSGFTDLLIQSFDQKAVILYGKEVHRRLP